MIVDTTSWILAGVGGILIGLASVLLLYFNGRIAGISGITGGMLLRPRGDTVWRLLFLAGMVAGGIGLLIFYPQAFPEAEGFTRSYGALVAAGLLVGFGTRLGSGCTSGHGVCGMSRLSPRSFVATGTFMLAGAIIVGFVRHALGGAI
jgi:uncharacterized membrane protein YedE/YeeE